MVCVAMASKWSVVVYLKKPDEMCSLLVFACTLEAWAGVGVCIETHKHMQVVTISLQHGVSE